MKIEVGDMYKEFDLIYITISQLPFKFESCRVLTIRPKGILFHVDRVPVVSDYRTSL